MFRRPLWNYVPEWLKPPIYGVSVVGLFILLLWGAVASTEACASARTQEARAWNVLAAHFEDWDAEHESRYTLAPAVPRSRAESLRDVAYYVRYGFVRLGEPTVDDVEGNNLYLAAHRLRAHRSEICVPYLIGDRIEPVEFVEGREVALAD